MYYFIGPSVVETFEGEVAVECHLQPADPTRYNQIMATRSKPKVTRMVQVMDPDEERRVMLLQTSTTIAPNGILGGSFGKSRVSKKLLSAGGRITKKSNLEKRERLPPQILTETLFRCFTRFEYWNLKGLVEATQQPVGFLKESKYSVFEDLSELRILLTLSFASSSRLLT